VHDKVHGIVKEYYDESGVLKKETLYDDGDCMGVIYAKNKIAE